MRRTSAFLLFALSACAAEEETVGLASDTLAADSAVGAETLGGDTTVQGDAVETGDSAVVDDAAENDAAGADPDSVDTTVVVTPLQAVYQLGDNAYPESVAFDPVQRAFFTSSLELGHVGRTDATGATTVFFAGNPEPDWLTLGLVVDVERRRLWVCAVFGKTIDRGEVWVLDVDTGVRLAAIDLEDAVAKAGCADFALKSDGGAYVTDRQAGRIYEIPAPSTPSFQPPPTPVIRIEDAALDPEVLGQNGIVLSADQNVLITEKYLPAKLMRIDLTTNAVAELAVDKPISDFGFGADALTVFQDKLYVILDERVAELTFADATWSSAKLTGSFAIQLADGDAVSGFSGITAAEGSLYASRSDVILYAIGSTSGLPFEIRRIDL